MLKKSIGCLIAILVCLSTVTMGVSAHSGRTDSSGGHKDNKNASGLGSYHYHCGGHPAHLHTNGVCPYSSNSSSSTVSNTTSSSSSTKPTQTKKSGWDGKKYYVNNKAVTGWQIINKKKYYFDSTGNLVESGCYIIDDKICTFDDDGVLTKTYKKITSHLYFFETSNEDTYGWYNLDNSWYYIRSNGELAENVVLKINNQKYTFNEYGVCTSGDVSKSIAKAKYDISCIISFVDGEINITNAGWFRVGSDWYYYRANEELAISISLKIDGVVYKFNDSGICTTPPDFY